jgi:NAD(P)-dependent dehydrogenase (short-subunit alcohol dehydrogenase family)
MEFLLTNKNILLTGSAGILGSQIALTYAKAGANLFLTDINTSALHRQFIKLKKINPNIFYLNADLTIERDVLLLKKRIIKEMGSLDVIFSNAAGKTRRLSNFFKKYENYDYSVWKEIINTNLDSMFLVTKNLGSLISNYKKGGSIILTSSIYGVISPDRRIYKNSFYKNSKIDSPAVYSASKAGIIGLMRYLSAYWGPSNIRVNCISPGGIESGQNKDFIKNYSNKVPLGKMGEIKDISGISLFLASDESLYFSGHNFIMDGGMSIW